MFSEKKKTFTNLTVEIFAIFAQEKIIILLSIFIVIFDL